MRMCDHYNPPPTTTCPTPRCPTCPRATRMPPGSLLGCSLGERRHRLCAPWQRRRTGRFSWRANC
eukprot:4349773-Prymnesium_polylepis.1